MKNLLFLLLLIYSFVANAQKFEYQGLFEGIGDNREYFSGKAMSQTILGSRGAFELGTSVDGHQIRAGLSQLYEFGSTIDFQQPKLILYYHYNDIKKDFYFGSFPRKGLIDFPLAMLTDTLLYYRPNIEGMLGEIRWGWGKQTAFVDWTSRQTDTKRETFMAGSSGEIRYKNLFIENYLLLYHHAGAAIDIPGDHIKDYLGYALQGGYRLNKQARVTGYIKTGILASVYRERSVTNGFVLANSMLSEVYMKYKNYAVKSVFHIGNGHRFYFGDPFYKVKSYMRTDVVWYFINHKNIKGRFNLSFHLIEGNDLDQSQQLSIVYYIKD